MGKFIVKKGAVGSAKMILACVVMLAACWYCTTLSVIAAILGWIGLLFFGYCTIIMIKQLMRNTLVVLDDNGFQEFTTALSGNFISWADVLNIQINGIMNQTFVCVDVKNAEEYIAKLSRAKRKLVVVNQALGFATIQINLNMANTSPQRLVEKMNEYLDCYKNNQQHITTAL